MTDATAAPEGDRTLFSGEYRTSSDFAARISGAFVRHAMLRVSRIITWVIVLVITVGLSLAVSVSPSPGTEWWAPLAFLAIFTVVYFGPLSIAYIITRKRIQRLVPPGSLYTMRLQEDSISLSDPLVSSQLSLQMLRGADRVPGFIRLRRRYSRIPILIPAEVFTDDSFDWLKQRLAVPFVTTTTDDPPATTSP